MVGPCGGSAGLEAGFRFGVVKMPKPKQQKIKASRYYVWITDTDGKRKRIMVSEDHMREEKKDAGHNHVHRE